MQVFDFLNLSLGCEQWKRGLGMRAQNQEIRYTQVKLKKKKNLLIIFLLFSAFDHLYFGHMILFC